MSGVMDAIASYCSSKVRVDNRSRGDALKCPETALLRKELSFSRPRKVFGFRILRLARLGPLCPAASAGLDGTGNGIEETYPSKTVHVRFKLKKECQFGEQFLLVGDDRILGSWNPSSAIPMNWSDGNLWTLDLDIPIGRKIQFKFILKGSTGIIQWQPDPDRVLETWETDRTITVCEDWEDAASQRITEGETLSDFFKEPTDGSEVLIVADSLSPPAEKVISETENGSALADIAATPGEIPLQGAQDGVETRSPLHKKSPYIVAENLTSPEENLSVDMADSIQTEEITGSEEKYGTILNKEMAVPQHVPRDNLKAKAIKSASTYSDRDLVTFCEGPVLVPGLTPLSMALSKEPIQLESEMSNAADVVTGYEATDPKVPELKEKQVPNSDHLQEEETAMAPIDHEKQPNEKQKEVPWLFHGQEKEVDGDEEEKVDPAQMDGVLKNDIQWGQKTLQNFLANLGLLL